MKPGRVEAWAVLNHYRYLYGFDQRGPVSKQEGDRRAVHLVEADPAADAVVSAAVALFKRIGGEKVRAGSGTVKSLRVAVERYRKKAKR